MKRLFHWQLTVCLQFWDHQLKYNLRKKIYVWKIRTLMLIELKSKLERFSFHRFFFSQFVIVIETKMSSRTKANEKSLWLKSEWQTEFFICRILFSFYNNNNTNFASNDENAFLNPFKNELEQIWITLW